MDNRTKIGKILNVFHTLNRGTKHYAQCDENGYANIEFVRPERPGDVSLSGDDTLDVFVTPDGHVVWFPGDELHTFWPPRWSRREVRAFMRALE